METTNKKAKRIVRRNLPINDTYTIVRSYHAPKTKADEDKGFDSMCVCANCNRIIVNVAVIKNSIDEIFFVGHDCAGTLSGIKGTDEYDNLVNNFNEAKGIRAKVYKYLKQYENAILKVENFYSGKLILTVSEKGRNYVNEHLEKEFFFSYLPEYLPKIINPEKNDYKFVGSVNDLNEYDFSKLSFKISFEPIKISVHGFDFILNTAKIKANAGKFNNMFDLRMYENGELLGTRNFYMNRDIKENIIRDINKVLFERF